MLDRIGVDGCERITDPWTRTDIPGVNQKLAVVTGQNGNVSSRTHKDAYVAAKFLDDDLAASRCGPGCLDQTFCSGEQMARGKPCNSGRTRCPCRLTSRPNMSSFTLCENDGHDWASARGKDFDPGFAYGLKLKLSATPMARDACPSGPMRVLHWTASGVPIAGSYLRTCGLPRAAGAELADPNGTQLA
jgi:hypothetical protein